MNDTRPTTPTLEVDGLVVEYPLHDGRHLRAVDDVSFGLAAGETLALVGESGCGKSSIVRALMQLSPHSRGRVRIGGTELGRLSRKELKRLRPRFQMIFQDPISSLNPRRRIRDILEAPLRINGRLGRAEQTKRIRAVLELVGLDPDSTLERCPHEFSGGQCQRISIARALVLEPMLLVCDEPVSALDVSVRAQVLNVLNDLRIRLGLSMLMITHDLAVVRNTADRVAVMYLGRICEIGAADDVLKRPAHPYTACLLSAVPIADPDRSVRRIELKGEIPSPMSIGSGCRFHSRCPAARAQCGTTEPELNDDGHGRSVACHFPFSVQA